MQTLKERYWKDGYIFRMSNNTYRMVWNKQLIDSHGVIPSQFITDDLHDADSLVGAHVIEVYEPNTKACYFQDLIRPVTEPIWSRYKAIYTMDEIKEILGFTQDTEIFILPNNTK